MEKTMEEVREEFLDEVRQVIDYWSNSTLDIKKACEGIAFGILVILDGENASMPSFIVAPDPDAGDREYFSTQNRKYYPDNTDTNVKCDIAGDLHNRLRMTA